MFKKKKKEKLSEKNYSNELFLFKLIKFIYYKFYDAYDVLKHGRKFKEYGLTLYVGDQGTGKTMALTEHLERLRHTFPNALIVTNYGYIHQHKEFTDWNDFFDIRNGTDGVIFALDEIQNEFNSNAWKTFPEELLSEITQQRKQKVKILATSQVWEDVTVQLRRQTLFVAEVSTLLERWTFVRLFKKRDYEKSRNYTQGTSNSKIYPMSRQSFIQSPEIRALYNTEQKIERLSRTRFMSKKDRGAVS